MPQRILVLGASGYIGQHLVQALSQQGHQVLAAARRIERLEKQQLANVSCHKVDLNWPDNLTPLLTGVDTVYYLVHGMGEGGDFIAHERQVAMNVRDALRGWAMTRGHQTVERPYEAWVDGINSGFTENGEFVVYWAVK